MPLQDRGRHTKNYRHPPYAGAKAGSYEPGLLGWNFEAGSRIAMKKWLHEIAGGPEGHYGLLSCTLATRDKRDIGR